MRHKGGVIGRGLFKRNVVESGLHVNHANLPCATQLGPVTTRIVQLILILIGAFVDRDYVLTHTVGLARLFPGN